MEVLIIAVYVRTYSKVVWVTDLTTTGFLACCPRPNLTCHAPARRCCNRRRKLRSKKPPFVIHCRANERTKSSVKSRWAGVVGQGGSLGHSPCQSIIVFFFNRPPVFLTKSCHLLCDKGLSYIHNAQHEHTVCCKRPVWLATVVGWFNPFYSIVLFVPTRIIW